MDLTRWIELVVAMVVLVGDFWAGRMWEAHRPKKAPPAPPYLGPPTRRST